jgi:hypothetical protein
MTTPALVYKLSAVQRYRVTWYGGESTQLHFEKLWNILDPDTDAEWQEWLDRDVRTLGGGVPTSMKEMLMEMEDYYHYSINMELERKL